jgi:hypothetical protein
MTTSSRSKLVRPALAATTALIYSLVLGACAGPTLVKSNVTSFSQQSLLDAGPKTFRFDEQPGHAGSLEHTTYEHLVSDQMLLLGYKEDPNGRLIVSFDYGLQEHELQTVSSGFGPSPYYGWGGYYGGGWGRRRFGYGGLGWGGGPWGWGGPWDYGPPLVTSETIARSQLRLDIRVAGTNAKAFEGTAVNTGRIDQLPVVMPYLVQAIFTDFPGLNGQTRRVSIPVVTGSN